MGPSHDVAWAHTDRHPESHQLPMGTWPPTAFRSAATVDPRNAETWRPVGLEQILPPADDREALVRHELAERARAFELRCVAAMIATASTSEAWVLISRDFASARTLHGPDNYGVLNAAEQAAEYLACGNLDGAIARLSRSCDSPEEWLADVRHERAAKGGAL